MTSRCCRIRHSRPRPTRATVAVSVDVSADRHPISPLIYGMASAPPDYLHDLRLGSNRWGGNDKSRYNWVLGNADNAARDWRFGNKTADGGAPNGVPSSAADAFMRGDQSGGAATLLTVPTLGWVARDADNATVSRGVPGAGGVPLADADGPIRGYDPSANRRRTSVRSVARKGSPFVDSPTLAGGVVYQDEWVHHLVTAFGPARAGGVRFYAMDNEPDLWDTTHTDVHPARMGYDDLLGDVSGVCHGGQGRRSDGPDHRTGLLGVDGLRVFAAGPGRRQLSHPCRSKPARRETGSCRGSWEGARA